MNTNENSLHLFDVVQWAKGECLQVGINSSTCYRICRTTEGSKGLEIGVATMDGVEIAGSWPECAWDLIKRYAAFTSESEAKREALWSKGFTVQISAHHPQGQLHGQEATIKEVTFSPVSGGYTPAYELDQFSGTHEEKHLDLLRTNSDQPLKDPLECITAEINPFKVGQLVAYSGNTDQDTGHVKNRRYRVHETNGMGVWVVGLQGLKSCADFDLVEDDAITTRPVDSILIDPAMLAESETEELEALDHLTVSGDISAMSVSELEVVLDAVSERRSALEREESKKVGAISTVGHAYRTCNGSIGIMTDQDGLVIVWYSGKSEDLYRQIEDLGPVGTCKPGITGFNIVFRNLIPTPKAD